MLMFGLTVAHGQAPSPEPAPAPPPAAPAQMSQTDLEKLLGPIALYPDSLVATILTASVYPLEVVQAARFVQNTNNLAKLDEQPWDANVKAVARVPDAIKKMNDDLDWTTQLGKAFLSQQKEVMDTIQSLRLKAQKSGTLKTSEQQTVVVTNMVVETTIEEKVVVVTNTVVQIQPTNPQVVYVPTYDPYLAYYPPYGVAAPIMTFAAGVAVGAIIANNCDWHGGGVYHGDVNINNNNNININSDRSQNTVNKGGQNRANQTKGSQKWQPDQSRLQSSGAPGSAQTAQARGWSDNGASSKTGATQGGQGGRSPSAQPAASPNNRPAANQPAANTRQASPQPAASNASRGQASPSATTRSQDSAFSGASGGSGASQRAESQRGASSRSSSPSTTTRSPGGGGGGGRSGGGGGRSGGGGGRR